MAITVPYLFFPGTAEEAMNFYKGIFGAELRTLGFDTFPSPDGEPAPPGLMHSDLWVDDLRLFASDGMPGTPPSPFANPEVCVAATPDEDEKATAWFNGLAEGGEVRTPLATMPWGDKFGQVIDKFNVQWMFSIGDSTVPGSQDA